MKPKRKPTPRRRYSAIVIWGLHVIRDAGDKRIMALCTQLSDAAKIITALNRKGK